MYLKTLELVGFKSFADKTRLEFEPGMTAIVGPNGCGKSNVADAIRWVLGEQSAKAMRGAKMEDVIFNGTDAAKPLGMAEVSMTLADCEASLALGFNEVTVTRRVFRSGEGQYFINKAPCRLKDIQRLFMDTGIGTNSYSLMEQGRIDRILSSRPEDRREVFEEASGITKYKADKREAIRKLDQTEQNLLRLADILREVKRQIISLQRQAGKARRYQELHTRLREVDLFATRERMGELDQAVTALETRVAELAAQDEAARAEIATVEEQAGGLRQHLAATENLISEAMEAAVRARTELERLRDQLRNNDDRRQELQQLAERDSKDASEARARLEQHELTLAEQQELRTRHEAARAAAEKELAEHAARLSACEKSLDENARLLHRLRTEQLESESRVAHLQNELSTLEAEERTNILRRERLAAEHAELQRNQQIFQTRSTEVTARQTELKAQTAGLQEQLQLLTTQRRDKATAVGGIKQEISELRAKVAARKAQIDMLQASQAQREGFPEGAKWVLDPKTQLPVARTQIIGSLAEQLRADAGYELALEAALRPWLDAIVVQDDAAAAALLLELEKSGRGSARLVMVAGSTPAAVADTGDLLVRHVRCADPIRPLLERMLGATQVVDTVAQIPSPVPAGAIFVTRQGVRLAADGVAEFWKRGSTQQNPLARRQLLADWQDQLAALLTDVQNREEALARLQQEETSVEEAAAAARERMEESRRALAVVEGEGQVIAREAKQAAQRVETVAWELKSLTEQNAGGDERRTAIHQGIDAQRQRQSDIRTAISTRTEEARDLETRRGQALSDVTERRVLFSESKQQVEAARSRIEQIDARVRELKALIEERSRGVLGYQKRIEELVAASASAQQQIPPLEQQVQAHNQRLDEARGKRDIMNASLSAQETELRMKREVLEQLRQRRSQGDVELAEQRMRRQTLLDRVVSEYRITSDQITSAPEPAWDNDQRPDRETMETMIAELRTKLEAMGPVNLVAIEEHRELEERLAFLTTQQTDLVNAKQQLMDLIREINKKTTEMFSDTFEKVNINFQEMFTKLFGGGQAKLVLVDEADVLESGIEIIARPPGKKLQTVSLLSGGERTMTAVALLFSLYLVKPSPFCVLDELDAALDEANIGRFVKTVQGFVENSQFVVITHNRMTISAAGVLYGVTMAQQGISKIVSVKFNEGARPEPVAPVTGVAAAASPTPATPTAEESAPAEG